MGSSGPERGGTRPGSHSKPVAVRTLEAGLWSDALKGPPGGGRPSLCLLVTSVFMSSKTFQRLCGCRPCADGHGKAGWWLVAGDSRLPGRQVRSLAGDMVVMGLAEASWVNIYLLPGDSSYQTKVRCKEGDCGGGGPQMPGPWYGEEAQSRWRQKTLVCSHFSS